MKLEWLLLEARNPHLGFFWEFGKALVVTVLMMDGQMWMENMVRMEGSKLL